MMMIQASCCGTKIFPIKRKLPFFTMCLKKSQGWEHQTRNTMKCESVKYQVMGKKVKIAFSINLITWKQE